MKLVAVKEFSYASKRLMRGQNFDASSRDARVLKAIGKAKDAPADEPVLADDSPAPPTFVAAAPTYQTRQLVPEPVAAVKEVSPAVRIRRKYTRRNLTPQR